MLRLAVQFLREQIVKGNALGSIFYGVGFSTPGIVNAAITGNDNYSPGPPGSKTYHGRHLAQATTPDNFNLIPKVRTAAPALTPVAEGSGVWCPRRSANNAAVPAMLQHVPELRVC